MPPSAQKSQVTPGAKGKQISWRFRLAGRKWTSAEISDYLKLYNSDETLLENFEEVPEVLQHVSELGRAFSNLHVELEVGFGEIDYQILFPKARDFKGKIPGLPNKGQSFGKTVEGGGL